MFGLKSKLLSSVILAALVSGASAADLPTTKGAPVAPAGPASCTGVQDFFGTNCVLSYWGLTFYGNVDLGGGWESHGTPLNRNIITGVDELVQKTSNKPMWLPAPGGLGQSSLGIKAKEEFLPSWYFIGDLSFGFDPYTLSLADGPRSFLDNNGRALVNQTANSDSSRAGQFYNGVGYVGISNATFGTLTFGRQNSLTLEGLGEYDPMGLAYAFSVLGWSGLTAGTGDTEDARSTTAIKYRDSFGSFRVSGLYQIGGYDLDNGAQAVVEAGVGTDVDLGAYGKLSFDVVATLDKGGVAAGPLTAAQNLKYPGTIAATISDNDGITLLGKWTYNHFKLMGGFEAIEFKNPSSPQLSTFTAIDGITIVKQDINNTAYTIPRYQDISWLGARYGFTETVDAGVAYYHYFQPSYSTTFCSNSSKSSCQGTLEAYSFDVDWKFSKKFDVYAGLMFSEDHDGLSSGFLHAENFAPTAGLRFKF